MVDKNNQLDKFIASLDKKVRKKFSFDTAHDMDHLYRAYNLALRIQKKEHGDKLIIGVAAFLHDIHRMKQVETGKFVHQKILYQ